MPSSHRTSWNGFYFDGQSQRRHQVTITLAPEGVHIQREDGSTLWWLYDQTHPPEDFLPGEPVRLERKDSLGEALLVPESEFLEALRQFAPGIAGRWRSPSVTFSRMPFLVGMAAVLLFVAAAVYLWGIPGLTRLAAARVPPEWEEQLGDAALAQMAPPDVRCANGEQQKLVSEIADQLMNAAPPSPYRLQLLIVDNPMANAFAVPGGRIVIFRGLLERTDRPEELAGVMAHEIQHVLLRHPLQAVLRQLSLQALAAVLAGDSSGMASALGAAGTIGGMRYQRGDEHAADREAVRMLQVARVDPTGLIEIFEKLGHAPGDTPSALQYLSTHPLTSDRVEELRKLTAQSSEGHVPLLPGVAWSRLRDLCKSK
ncbi:MAG: M48 family metallopeptidase [Acidobacteria bacterium]|nr:M48 family metallopeptidase [Acidobacteriota bacterium]